MCSFPYIGIGSVGSIDWENIEKTLIDSVCGKPPRDFPCNSHYGYAFCELDGECWLCKKILVLGSSAHRALLDTSRVRVVVSLVKNYLMCGDCAKVSGIGIWKIKPKAPHSKLVECKKCGLVCRPVYQKRKWFYVVGWYAEERYEKTEIIIETECQWCRHLEAKKYKIECERKQVMKLINQVKKELKNAEKSNNDNGAVANCTV